MAKWNLVYESSTTKSRKYSPDELKKLAEKKFSEYNRFGRKVKMTKSGGFYRVYVDMS